MIVTFLLVASNETVNLSIFLLSLLVSVGLVAALTEVEVTVIGFAVCVKFAVITQSLSTIRFSAVPQFVYVHSSNAYVYCTSGFDGVAVTVVSPIVTVLSFTVIAVP